MTVRGIRGAITVNEDEPAAVLEATRRLLLAIQDANPGFDPDDAASILFTTTADLVSVFPAQAARQLGWNVTPLICAQEIPVPGSLPRCVRVLIHWNCVLPPSAVRHIYLGEAASLRPDLSVS